ncbi:MAG: hypothetical protein IPI67_33280 [Myxococcales bacterium]|nr:hypothetical protein [Myxococcales bacterium]
MDRIYGVPHGSVKVFDRSRSPPMTVRVPPTSRIVTLGADGRPHATGGGLKLARGWISAWTPSSKRAPTSAERCIPSAGGEHAPSADRPVPSTRARASIGKTLVVSARHHRSRAPGKEGTGERSETRGGSTSGVFGAELRDGAMRVETNMESSTTSNCPARW